jgi:hypothetical protein
MIEELRTEATYQTIQFSNFEKEKDERQAEIKILRGITCKGSGRRDVSFNLIVT